ncbi:MAG: deoxyribodipyrimidine photo-lyase, partial [Ardenticatenaceae bacterium]|nr:deoxyribodipyrimidine photo-lyase [Ardenticatenaceae bacterium]
MTKTAVWWIRRDLRLTDNTALTAALAAAPQVLPLFILDPALLASAYVGEKRLAFLWAGLRQLDADLRQRGSYLVMRQGEATAVFTQLQQEIEIGAIFAAEDFSPYARQRDTAVSNHFQLHLLPGVVVQHPTEVLKQDGLPYTVFTPFSKAWRQRPLPTPADLLPAPAHIPTPANVTSLPIPERPFLTTAIPFQAGETAAQQRLDQFTATRIGAYKQDRDFVALDGTSALSPYLRFGMLSARQAVVAALTAYRQAITATTDADGKGPDTWLNELIWREFYVTILYHFPHVMRGSFRREYDAISWHNDAEEFAAWRSGQTGYPIVDAAMRQLQQSGWMHNRARMIVASFLVKDLLIDWRWGETWFMQQLIDGDPAANNGGWQWTAGTGTDAAPYFRIFNPVSQSQKFDPHGDYIRRWVPELRQVPGEFIHEPWLMSALAQKKSGCVIGQDYPRPIVDHKMARQRTLEAYKLAKENVA